LGIYVLVGPQSKNAVELTLYLGAEPRIYRTNHPKGRFTGKLMIDGAEITKDSDIAQIARAAKGRPIEQMQGEDKGHYWDIKRKVRGDAAVGIETEDGKGKGVRDVSVTF